MESRTPLLPFWSIWHWFIVMDGDLHWLCESFSDIEQNTDWVMKERKQCGKTKLWKRCQSNFWSLKMCPLCDWLPIVWDMKRRKMRHRNIWQHQRLLIELLPHYQQNYHHQHQFSSGGDDGGRQTIGICFINITTTTIEVKNFVFDSEPFNRININHYDYYLAFLLYYSADFR